MHKLLSIIESQEYEDLDGWYRIANLDYNIKDLIISIDLTLDQENGTKQKWKIICENIFDFSLNYESSLYCIDLLEEDIKLSPYNKTIVDVFFTNNLKQKEVNLLIGDIYTIHNQIKEGKFEFTHFLNDSLPIYKLLQNISGYLGSEPKFIFLNMKRF